MTCGNFESFIAGSWQVGAGSGVALRDATSGPEPDQALLSAIAARPVLGRLLPDREASPPPADVPGLAQQLLFGAVLGILAELAAQRPVLLVLEDLHWADRSTRDLLTFLSRVLHREKVAVVVTYRTDDLHRRHPLRPVVAELLRLPGVTAIELAPVCAASALLTVTWSRPAGAASASKVTAGDAAVISVTAASLRVQLASNPP